MNELELKELWKQEESIAHIHGWDFTHIAGRYTEQDDLPWDIPEPVAEFKPYCPAVPQTACPSTGSLSFKCPANVALNTLKELLQNEMVAISITWRVMEEGGDDDV